MLLNIFPVLDTYTPPTHTYSLQQCLLLHSDTQLHIQKSFLSCLVLLKKDLTLIVGNTENSKKEGNIP